MSRHDKPAAAGRACGSRRNCRRWRLGTPRGPVRAGRAGRPSKTKCDRAGALVLTIYVLHSRTASVHAEVRPPGAGRQKLGGAGR